MDNLAWFGVLLVWAATAVIWIIILTDPGSADTVSGVTVAIQDSIDFLKLQVLDLLERL